MAVRMEKPWRRLDEENVAKLAGQLGVFELADDSQQTIYVGCADARSLFGLKGELQSWLGKAAHFRIEVTTAYRTRYRELLMVHHADRGSYPELNSTKETAGLGRLSP